MKYYCITIQVDFDSPRPMSPLTSSGKPWRSVGYFQQFYCTEQSKEKAKKLIHDYFLKNEDNPTTCKFRFDRVAWMQGISNREQLTRGINTELTEEMFNKRDKIGIWFCDKKEHYVSEEDYAASAPEENFEDSDDEDYWHNYDGECQACDIYGPVDDMSLCDECADKLERDLIRQHDWDHCVSAFVLPGKEREKLRNNVIKKYGKALELIVPSDKAGYKRSSRRRKKK
jgi:hypothetical protein